MMKYMCIYICVCVYENIKKPIIMYIQDTLIQSFSKLCFSPTKIQLLPSSCLICWGDQRQNWGTAQCWEHLPSMWQQAQGSNPRTAKQIKQDRSGEQNFGFKELGQVQPWVTSAWNVDGCPKNLGAPSSLVPGLYKVTKLKCWDVEGCHP